MQEVEIIWLESFDVAELKKLAKSERFNEKLPILFSSCHSKQSLAQWILQEQLEEVGFHTLTGEWLSPYNSKSEMRAGLKLELSELLGKNIKITMNKPIPELLP